MSKLIPPLKTCPFCGGQAHTTPEIQSANLAALVMCTDNDCATLSGRTLAEAIQRWNTRYTGGREEAARIIDDRPFEEDYPAGSTAAFNAQGRKERALEKADAIHAGRAE